MTAEQLVTRGLIIHIDEHVGSIRKAVGTDPRIDSQDARKGAIRSRHPTAAR